MRLDGTSQPKSQDIHAIVGLLLILGIRLLDHRQLSLQLGKAPRGFPFRCMMPFSPVRGSMISNLDRRKQ